MHKIIAAKKAAFSSQMAQVNQIKDSAQARLNRICPQWQPPKSFTHYEKIEKLGLKSHSDLEKYMKSQIPALNEKLAVAEECEALKE